MRPLVPSNTCVSWRFVAWSRTSMVSDPPKRWVRCWGRGVAHPQRPALVGATFRSRARARVFADQRPEVGVAVVEHLDRSAAAARGVVADFGNELEAWLGLFDAQLIEADHRFLLNRVVWLNLPPPPLRTHPRGGLLRIAIVRVRRMLLLSSAVGALAIVATACQDPKPLSMEAE